MKYEERLLQVRTSIADTARADEERRVETKRKEPGRLSKFFGGANLLWQLPVLLALVVVCVRYPSTIIREVNRYVHIPNWVLNLIPGYGYGSVPGPLGLMMMGTAGILVVAGGLGIYVGPSRPEPDDEPLVGRLSFATVFRSRFAVSWPLHSRQQPVSRKFR